MITEAALSYGFETLNDDYVLVDAFTTLHGSWEVRNQFWSVPQWARDKYLKPWGHPDYSFDFGADHHVFIRILGEDGSPQMEDYILLLANERTERFKTKDQGGWANHPVYNSIPGNGIASETYWYVQGEVEPILKGGGLPFNQHVSLYVVLQKKSSEVKPEVPVDNIEVSVDGDVVIIDSKGNTFSIEVM